MFRAMLFMKVKAGQEEAFERAWREVAAHACRAPGNIQQALLRDPDDGSTFVISTDWASREAFRQFERSPMQDELTRPLRELRESVHMAGYDLVAHLAAADDAQP
jgi:heme-degrading monooxygenase HmoA